jgi:hypothetical protein
MASPTQETAMRHNDRQTALDAFIARKAEIDTMLERIKALSDEHFDYNPRRHQLGPRRHARSLRRAAQADHRRGVQGGRARCISRLAPTSPRTVIAVGAWGSSRAAMVVAHQLME